MFFDEQSNLPVGSFYKGEPAAWGEIYEVSRQHAQEVTNQGAIYRQLEEEIDWRNDAIRSAGGPQLDNPFRRAMTEEERRKSIEASVARCRSQAQLHDAVRGVQPAAFDPSA